MNRTIYYIIFILAMIFTVSCIERITIDSLPENTPDILVIEGNITDEETIQTIKIGSLQTVNSQVFLPIKLAQVYVVDEDNNFIEFFENAPGVYQQIFRAENGQSYHLEIILPDGTMIQSETETTPSPVELDSVRFEQSFNEFLDDSGVVQQLWQVDFFASGSTSSNQETDYLRFSSEGVWQMVELVCNPLVCPDICYINDFRRLQKIELLELPASEESANFEKKVFSREIDVVFGQLYGLRVNVLSHTPEAYQYWTRVKQLFDASGDVFSGFPSAITGNLTASNEQPVIGYFSASSTNFAVTFVRRNDVVDRGILPYCGVPGFPPDPFLSECCNCLRIPNSSLIRPDYW